MLVDQRAEDDPGEIGETDRCDVVDESTFPFDLEPVVEHYVPELHGAASAGRTGQAETELVDRQPQVLDLVVGETEPAGEPRRGYPRQPEEFWKCWYQESHLVGLAHEPGTVAAPQTSRSPARRPGFVPAGDGREQ